MDLESNKIFISQNVVFHEDLFPLKKNSMFEAPEWLKSKNSEPQVTSNHSQNSPSHSIPISPSQISKSHVPSTHSHIVPSPSIPISPSEISKSRVKKVPSHLQDSHCYALTPNNDHPIQNFLSYSKLSPSHNAYINAITKIPIPSSYIEAQRDKEWCDAVDLEFGAMESTHTWDVTSLPKGKKAIYAL